MLNLTSSEKKTLIITLFVISISALVQFFQPGSYKPDDYDYSKMDSIFQRRSYYNPDSLLNVVQSQQIEKKVSDSEKKIIDIPLIYINSASGDDLEKLPRIGPAIAERILEFREANGPFKTKQDLLQVKGIGKKTLEKISPYIEID